MHKKEQEQEQDQKQKQDQNPDKAKSRPQAQSQGQEQVFFENREALRSWLEKHHDNSPGIWMIYYKKHTDKPCIEYREALEEALCFGWIDSTLKKVDEERYLRKFTPRRKGSKWSQVNIRIAQALIREGKMTRVGLGKWENHKPLKELPGKEIPLSEFLREAFGQNEPALENFQNLAPSYRRQYILWITSAKTPETVQKRISESIGLLKENRKLGMR
jgi:uncharacterized protein YdeI (YjbR/CyaY-like superfamily)